MILQTNNTVEIYRYAVQILKNMPKKPLEAINETLLYKKEKVVLTGNRDRRLSNTDTNNDRTDDNLNARIINFHGQLGQKLNYRIPINFFTDLGLVNFAHKTDTKFLFTLESNMNKLFESNTKANPIVAKPNAEFLYQDTPYIYYQQITLDYNFLSYFNATLSSKTALRTGVFNAPYNQSFEIKAEKLAFMALPYSLIFWKYQ